MHKESLVAIVVGLSLGLLVAASVYRFRQAVTTQIPETPSASVPAASTPDDINATLFSLAKPENGTVTSSKSLTVSGTAQDPAALVLFVGNNEQVLTPKEDGSFSTDVTLSDGPNTITVMAIDEVGKTESVDRLVVVDAGQADLPPGDASDSASITPAVSETETTQALKDRINDKLSEDDQIVSKTLESIDKLRKAFLGQVERVTDEAIRVATADTTIVLSVNDLPSIRKGGAQINAEDVEVGNWGLVIGSTQGENTPTNITPEKLLVYTSSPLPKPPVAMIGALQSVTSSSVQVLSRQDGQDSTFKILKTTKFQDSAGKSIKAADLPEDVSVLVIGYKEDDDQFATTVRSLAPITPTEEP